jgi:hypothetical protein
MKVTVTLIDFSKYLGGRPAVRVLTYLALVGTIVLTCHTGRLQSGPFQSNVPHPDVVLHGHM